MESSLGLKGGIGKDSTVGCVRVAHRERGAERGSESRQFEGLAGRWPLTSRPLWTAIRPASVGVRYAPLGTPWPSQDPGVPIPPGSGA